jgi:simple sugar transport system permease protein
MAGPDAATVDVVGERKAGSAALPTRSLAGWYRDRRGRGALEIAIIFVIVQIGCIAAWVHDSAKFAYLSQPIISVMSQSISWLGLLGIGAGVLMIAGEFDLSMAMNLGMCQLVFITWYSGGNNAWVCVGVTIATGVFIALINGVIVTTFRIPSFIATLGMASLLWGAQLWYNGENNQQPRIVAEKLSPSLKRTFAATLGLGIRGQFLWLIGIGAVVWMLLHRHRLGNHLFAVGGNENAAKAISINPKRIKLIAFAILGALVGLAAVLVCVQVRTFRPGDGAGIELQAITGAVVGGTALRGGKGSVLGMILGVALIKTFSIIVTLAHLPGLYEKVFVGALIVIFVILNQYFEGKAE